MSEELAFSVRPGAPCPHELGKVYRAGSVQPPAKDEKFSGDVEKSVAQSLFLLRRVGASGKLFDKPDTPTGKGDKSGLDARVGLVWASKVGI